VIHSGSKFGIDRELLLYVGNEDRDLLFKRASQGCAGVSDFCAEFDRRMIATALQGTQHQVLARAIEQEQRHVVE
jgi:hypothetical protein